MPLSGAQLLDIHCISLFLSAKSFSDILVASDLEPRSPVYKVCDGPDHIAGQSLVSPKGRSGGLVASPLSPWRGKRVSIALGVLSLFPDHSWH